MMDSALLVNGDIELDIAAAVAIQAGKHANIINESVTTYISLNQVLVFGSTSAVQLSVVDSAE